jgi:diguanylate cyclase (GGDEF)-like protein
MDIDCFKFYNDTYGHQMGDDVLIQVAKAMKESLHRADDYCFRLGGEEFGVYFKAKSKEDAVTFANLIRTNIENLQIEHKKNPASPFVTSSAGLVVVDAYDISESDELYKDADDLLYKAKESGRNRVVVNEDGANI